jgi:hypothetical protein
MVISISLVGDTDTPTPVNKYVNFTNDLDVPIFTNYVLKNGLSLRLKNEEFETAILLFSKDNKSITNQISLF